MALWLETKFFKQSYELDLRRRMLSLDLCHNFRTFDFAINVSHRIFPCDQNVGCDERC